MEGLFELEAPPLPAPRFRSLVACLRLCLRPAQRALASRGTALDACFVSHICQQAIGAASFPAGLSFVSYWLSPSHTKQAQKGGLEVPATSYADHHNPFPATRAHVR